MRKLISKIVRLLTNKFNLKRIDSKETLVLQLSPSIVRMQSEKWTFYYGEFLCHAKRGSIVKPDKELYRALNLLRISKRDKLFYAAIFSNLPVEVKGWKQRIEVVLHALEVEYGI